MFSRQSFVSHSVQALQSLVETSLSYIISEVYEPQQSGSMLTVFNFVGDHAKGKVVVTLSRMKHQPIATVPLTHEARVTRQPLTYHTIEPTIPDLFCNSAFIFVQ